MGIFVIKQHISHMLTARAEVSYAFTISEAAGEKLRAIPPTQRLQLTYKTNKGHQSPTNFKLGLKS